MVKEGNADTTYLTTLCEDCIKYTRSYGILVKEEYLMVDKWIKSPPLETPCFSFLVAGPPETIQTFNNKKGNEINY